MGFFGGNSADLLFNIKADASGAQRELRGFRADMRSELSEFRNQFAAVAAGVGAVVAATVGTMVKLGLEAAKYAGEIETASDKTGIAVEDLSKLRYAADTAGINMGTLTNNLVLFTASITDARRGVLEKKEAFEELGITQDQLNAGSKEMLPLLYQVSDAFERQASTVQRTAAARKLFGRGGAEMVEWLSRGSDSMKHFTAEAERLGLVFTTQDIVAAKQFGLELKALTAEADAAKLALGRWAIPGLTSAIIGIKSLFAAAKGGLFDPAFFARWGAEMVNASIEAEQRIQAALTQAGTVEPPEAAGGKPEKIKETTAEFRGLSEMLNQVRGRIAGLGTAEQQIAHDTDELHAQLAETVDELKALEEGGKITAETFQRELGTIRALGDAINELTQRRQSALAIQRQEAQAAEEAANARYVHQQLMEAEQSFRESFDVGMIYPEEARRSIEDYRRDLNLLVNSQGWNSVFGEYFAQQIRYNESLLQEWAQTANQSLMMVDVALETIRENMRQAFGQFAQAMGANVAAAVVYQKSIGEAMKAATAATLQQIAAQSYVQAIYATALGFLRIAQWDWAGAAAAFQAAALFGTVGTAAAVAGRAIAPRQEAAGGAGAGGGGGTTAGTESGAGGGSQGGPRVAIYVSGNIIGQAGIEELTGMINDAVQHRDVRLVATQVRQGGQLTR